jgi:hypothetical protein
MTIINHHHRFVFVHIPKNAGTSVAQYLSQVSSYRDQEIGATELGEALAPAYRRRFDLHKHSTYAEIEQVVGAELMGSYTTLAVARDPADRVRSIYSFLRKWSDWTDLDPAYRRYGDEFAELADVDDFVASDLFLMPGPDRLFMPQASWLSNAAGDRIAVDHIVRYQDLDAGMARLVASLGLSSESLRKPLPRANVSRSDRPVASLSEASLARVRTRYRLDYELLGPWG